MKYEKKLESLAKSTKASIDKSLSKTMPSKMKKFNTIIDDFLKDLNTRYPRHLFLFEELLNGKMINCHERKHGRLVCVWRANYGVEVVDDLLAGHFWDYNCPLVCDDVEFEESQLSENIGNFIKTVDKYFGNVFAAESYFVYKGKSHFDKTTDCI